MPDVVIAFRLSIKLQRCLFDALGGVMPVHYTADLSECVAYLRRQHSAAVVVQVPHTVAEADLSALTDLRVQFPFVPILGIFHGARSDLSAVARLGAVGVLDVIPADSAHSPDTLMAQLSRGQIESLVTRIWRLSSLEVAETVATVLRPAVRLAHAPISVPRLAAAMRMHERSLRKYCESKRLPSPQWIIGWARTLVIAYYLEEKGRSVQSIATLLGFASTARLDEHLRRYTGAGAKALRVDTPLNAVARRLEAALAPASEQARPPSRSLS